MEQLVKKIFDPYQVSLGVSLVISSTVISFREYFLTNPLGGGFGLVNSLQVLSEAALAGLILLPPLILGSPAKMTNSKSNLLIWSALGWPVSLMLVRLAVWQATGLFAVDYWLSYPILFLCEFGATAIYIYIAMLEKKTIKMNSPVEIATVTTKQP